MAGPAPAPRRRGLLALLVATALVVAITGAVVIASRARRPSLVVDGRRETRRLQGKTFVFVARGLTPCGEVSRVYRPPTHPVPGQAEMVLGTRADARGELRFSTTAGCDMLDTAYRVEVADHRTGRRTNPVTMTVVSNPHCGSHLPDLVIEKITRDRARVSPGDTFLVDLIVRNDGRTESAPSTTRLRLGAVGRTNVSDPAMADLGTPGIPPGRSTTLTANVRIPDGTAPGTYAVWAILDNGETNFEWRTKNNFAESEPVEVGDVLGRAGAAKPECR